MSALTASDFGRRLWSRCAGGGCSYTLIAGFLGVPASEPVDLTGVCALGNVGFVIILTVAALVNFLSQSPWERFLLAPTALLLAALSLIVAIKGTGTVNTSSAELEDPGPGATSRW
jgi:hypothetical protein